MHTLIIRTNKLTILLLCFLQLDFAFLSPFGTPWKPTQIEVAHALGRVHVIGRTVLLDIELTGSGLQHLPAEIAFSLFHYLTAFLSGGQFLRFS